jgi:hypothetical protein
MVREKRGRGEEGKRRRREEGKRGRGEAGKRGRGEAEKRGSPRYAAHEERAESTRHRRGRGAMTGGTLHMLRRRGK